jgi:hypothetical protein
VRVGVSWLSRLFSWEAILFANFVSTALLVPRSRFYRCLYVSPRYIHTFPQEPGGKRFLVENGHVDYLGWSFNIGHSPIAGVKLYNVRYRGCVVCRVCLGVGSAVVVRLLMVCSYWKTCCHTAYNGGALIFGLDVWHLAVLCNRICSYVLSQ